MNYEFKVLFIGVLFKGDFLIEDKLVVVGRCNFCSYGSIIELYVHFTWEFDFHGNWDDVEVILIDFDFLLIVWHFSVNLWNFYCLYWINGLILISLKWMFLKIEKFNGFMTITFLQYNLNIIIVIIHCSHLIVHKINHVCFDFGFLSAKNKLK